jgi:hypothetical protein
MAVVRRASVSTKNSWFRRNPASPLNQTNRKFMSKNIQKSAVKLSETQVVRSRRNNNLTRKLSKSPLNEVVLPTFKPESRPQVALNIPSQFHENLPMMSTTGATPAWLLRLHSVYRYSSGAAFLLVVATLMVYGWTVYSQELWSQAYRTLQGLQRHERQLTTTNATLTSNLAKEAEAPEAGLVLPTPGRVIFLPSTDNSPSSVSPNTTPKSETPSHNSSPLGY